MANVKVVLRRAATGSGRSGGPGLQKGNLAHGEHWRPTDWVCAVFSVGALHSLAAPARMEGPTHTYWLLPLPSAVTAMLSASWERGRATAVASVEAGAGWWRSLQALQTPLATRFLLS